MTFNDYEEKMLTLRKYPDVGNNIVYPALGLAGEAGEVADKVKKVLRDAGGILSKERRLAIAMEVGDVLWYVSAMANELGYSLTEVAEMNLNKLLDRSNRNMISGDGDNR